MKKSNHTRRFDTEAQAAIARILVEDVSDKALRFLSITGAEVAPDKSFMRVYVSCAPESYKRVEKALARAKGYIRTCLGRELSWRIVPDLDFKIDTTEDQAKRVEDALKIRPQFMTEDEADE